jgi:hypothetical protein
VRSPDYGKVRRPRPPRVLFVVDQYPFALPNGESVVAFTLQQPGRGPIAFPARDQGYAVRLVDLLKQGMFDREMGLARP